MPKGLLITGSNGFVGKSLVRYLQKEQKIDFFPFTAQELDVTNEEDFYRLQPDKYFHVVHLAAKTFVPDSWDNPASFFDVNVAGTKNVLEFCRKNNLSLTYLSSYLYGQPKKLPVAEDAKIDPVNPYAFSKTMAEQLCAFYAREFGVKVVVLRPFNIFGPEQSDKFLIPHIILQALGESSIKVQDLTPKRDYVYIADFLQAIMLSVKCAACLEGKMAVFNVGSGYSVSVQELITYVQSILHIDKQVVSKEERRINEISDVVADVSKIQEALGWRPQYSLLEGLTETINFYWSKE